jgi:hypothetical protein
MMIAVTLAAVDLALIRAAFGKAMNFGMGLEVLIQTIPMGLALNFGLLRAFCVRGRPRAFWMGFIACGTAAMISSAWAALTPAGSVHPANGAPNYILEGSRVWAIWQSYFEFAAHCLISLGLDVTSLAPSSLDHPGIGYITVVGILALLPQLALALVGGLLTRSWGRSHLVARGAPSPTGGDSLREGAAPAN